jgi:hypothetical protein
MPTGLDAPIASLEWVLLATPQRHDELALVFRCDDAQLERWLALKLDGAELELVDGFSNFRP